jgi:hypothetical protein
LSQWVVGFLSEFELSLCGGNEVLGWIFFVELQLLIFPKRKKKEEEGFRELCSS